MLCLPFETSHNPQEYINIDSFRAHVWVSFINNNNKNNDWDIMTHFKRLNSVERKKFPIMLFLILIFQAFFVISKIPIVSGWVFWEYMADGTVVSVGVSADGNYTVAGTDAGSVFLLDGNGSLLWPYHFTVAVECVAISGDGSRIAVGIHEYRSAIADIYLFDNQGNIIWQRDLVEGSWPCDVAISPDATYIVTGDTDNKVYFYDISGTSLIWTYTAGHWVSAVSVSSEGEYTAAGSWDNSLYFFNKSGNLLWSQEFETSVYAVSVSSDGGYVAAQSSSQNVSLFDKTGGLLLETPFHISVKAISLSANADRIAVGAYYRITVIDKTANIIFERETDDSVEDVAVTADGKFVAFGSGDYVYFLETLPPSTITCEISISEVAFDEPITVSGYVSPSPVTGTEVTLTYTRPDDSSLTRTPTTDQLGFYNDTFTPDMIGVWAVKASWKGDEQHAGSESPPQSFTVGKSEITCDVSPAVIFLGDSAKVNGSLNPPISGVQVTLEYKLYFRDSTYNHEGFVNVTRTVMTLADGSFTDVFTPSEAGRWKTNASWAGDAEHMASETQAYLAVNPAVETNLLSAIPVTLYWHREQWYCTDDYFMDLEMPTSTESETVAFDPGAYWWIGHGHWYFKGVHTGQLSESILIEEGYWNLSIWAAAREPSQHFVVSLYYWDESHDANLIAGWDTGYFNSTSPDDPTEFTHSYALPTKIIPKGSCLGLVISECRDADIRWFFDSTTYPSYLSIPPSAEVQTSHLTITTTAGGTTTPSPRTHTYLTDTEVTVTAIPEAGYSFDHWKRDGINIGSDNPVDILMDNNHTLLAVFIDDIPPEIGNPVQDPPENIQPGQNVTVTAIVTDAGSGVYNVTLLYNIANGTTWTPLNMIEIDVNTYQAKIDGYENCTWVRYKITSYDNAENQAANDNEGYYYVYHVIPEFPTTIVMLLLLFLVAISLLTTKTMPASQRFSRG
jgi:WD40 repeat protein